MVKLINWLTGTEMYVAEDRLDDYLKAGHKLPKKTEKAKTPVTEKPKARKKTSKK